MSLVNEYLEYLAEDRNYSPRTIRTYRTTLDNIPNVDHATRTEVEAWWTTTRPLAPASRQNKLSTLRSFYKWQIRFEHRDDDPTIRLDAPKVDNSQPHPVSRAELEATLKASPPAIRRAVALCAYSGMRVAEAAALDWRDVDEENRRVWIRRGKGAKDRAVGLPALLYDEVGPRVQGNVVAAGGTPYTANALQTAINRVMARAGIANSSHGLRGRFATIALTSTNLLSVSRALGHASTATTARYAATADSDLDLIADAVTRGA